MIRRKKEDNHTQSSMSPSASHQSRRPGKVPILLTAAVCSVAVIYTSFFMSTFDSIDTGDKGLTPKPKGNRSSTSSLRKYAPATDKTYKPKKTKSGGSVSCSAFDHGDTSPTPGIQSMFNCNSEEGTCKWHYPAKFFDGTCGIGKDYVGEIKTLKEMHENRTLWLDGPPIVIPWVSLNPGVKFDQFRKEPYPVHNLSMTHVHKTGGVSSFLHTHVFCSECCHDMDELE